MNNKKLVKYQSLFDKEQTIDGVNALVVYRKASRSKCKCHHCRISQHTGLCTFGRCRHDMKTHWKQEVLA
jgi:hypothetical protein